ncbi:RNA-directed DNA polymerase [Candidatus Accumulibacter cognatus]|uniref:Retron-type reverse transcriptase n=1 Tax=Candidatus Accumulibacter cognatus TaxID=2954383 RepID=A0A080M163_9PROT|nr:RNA-directed DNA polymerase [Candidatus Accumulibacter cognatus]KFB75012.1 MAG: Retron-type reverse transcriptase [Candidatus Accumulibacter cognatus]
MSSELHFFAIHALDGRAAQDELNAHVPSIDHARLKALLARRFKGDGFLALLGRIIDAGGAAGRGLPIGSLTSQHFANAYLDVADRWLLEDRRVRAQLRYMDDILWWCGYPVNSAACLQGKKCCRARAARRLLEQRRQERPLSEPQRQRQPERRFPLCPELDRRRVWQHPGMDLPLPMDQALFPVAVAPWPRSKLEGSRGAGSEGAAALTRQLPGSPPALASR